MIRTPRRSVPSLAGEQGFSLIEVIVAALMLAVMVGAASTLFVEGSDSSLSSQRDSQLISVADQQIETIREEVKTKGFDALAMSSLPATASRTALPYSSTTPVDPNYFVSAGTGCGSSNEGYEIEENYDNTSSGAASGMTPWSGCTDVTTSPTAVAEPLEVLSGGFVSPGPTTVTIGATGQTATIDEYVTDTYLGCDGASTCPTISSGKIVCPSGTGWPTSTSSSTTCGDVRRVIVAVIPASGGRYNLGQTSPVYVSTIFTNPTPSNSATGTLGLTLGLQLG